MLLDGCLQISEHLKWMKNLLFGYHDNRPMNKNFLLIFAHFGLKRASFLNPHKTIDVKLAH